MFAFRPIVQAPWRWRQEDENSRQPGLHETLLINKRKLQRNQQLLQNIRNNCQIPCGFGLGLTRNVKRMRKEWVHRHTQRTAGIRWVMCTLAELHQLFNLCTFIVYSTEGGVSLSQ